MSDINSYFQNARNFSIKCPIQTEFNCIQKCAKWIADIKIKKREFIQNNRIEVDAITTRNFKESFCKLLMLHNDIAHPPSFDCVKNAYGNPYLRDIENIRPTLPIDQTNINLSSLGPEFFTFFIEIDLDKTLKGEANKLRRIESDFDLQEYELYLNATIHNSELLLKNFYAKIDSFKIIKSIQYRVEAHKQQFKNLKNHEIYKREFFVKILEEDINMGVEFTIPEETNIESFPTNHNNIINSNILINKFYVEIILPISFFFRTPCIQNPSQIKENINNLVNKYKKNNEENNPNVTDLIRNNKKILNNLKNSMISPKIKNEMSQIIFSQLSNNTGHSNLSKNSTLGNLKSCLKSRNSQDTHIKIESIKNNYRDTNPSKNIETTSSSLTSSHSNNTPNFNKYDNMNKSGQNSNISSPNGSNLFNNSSQFEGFSLNPPNIFNYQPSTFYAQRNAFNVNHYNPLFCGMTSGIKQNVYFDTEAFFKKIKDYYHSFGQDKEKNNLLSRRFLSNRERCNLNISNFQIFMTTSTPLNLETEDTPVRSFFFFYEKPSILGLEFILKNSGTNIMTNYEPSLSSLHIELSSNFYINNSTISSKSTKVNELLNSTINNKTYSNSSSKVNSITSTPQPDYTKTIPRVISDFNLNKNNDLSSSNYSNSSFSVENISVISTDENINEKFKLQSFVKKCPVIDFTEDQPLHNRPNFMDKIKEIFSINPEFENLTLNDITDNSYFSVLWTPIKSTHNYVNTASFLIFYRFRNKYLSNAVKYVPVIGLVTHKLEEEFWLTNVNHVYNPNYMTETALQKMIEDFSKNKYRYNQVIEFCNKFVNNNKITNNIDYYYFQK